MKQKYGNLEVEMLLTLDLATVLGFTVGPISDRKFMSGHFRLPSTGPDIGRFAAAYEDWLHSKLLNVTSCCFEAPILAGKTQLMTVRKLCGLAYHTELMCTQMSIECREAHLQSVKKAIGGHGRAQKSDMIRAVQSYGYEVTEENEADAIAVRLYTIMTRHREYAADFKLDLGLLGTVPKQPTRIPIPERRVSQLLWPED